MNRKALITVGTDGVVDFVQTPDGQRYMLGTVSVLRLISNLVPKRHVKRALDEFLQEKRTLISVDLDKMWNLLPFRRARYSSADSTVTTNPLINSKIGDISLETHMKTASFETFSANMDVAENIVAKVAQTDSTINSLVGAGKRFNSVRAKADLHKIASRLSELAQTVDLAQPWVAEELEALSKQADEIHGLFHKGE